ncbi:uncharacterized protein LOC132722790 [Ruditapes philippinarum]|uniref:uncharacterized protein LOC132722790 n=1 Tax=Ruditapes philippinarum TaxID=129788 RepID=UPI00295A8B92|nr:uncharacterized protein LOC132722790 [Ruditapes philippinarum]
MTVKALVLVLVIGICSACDISKDCNDYEGRSLCYEKDCRRDVPCNKDNDCFFYGASDVSQGFPHPKCFLNPKVRSAPGYGVCMESELADGLERLPGDDVIDIRPLEEKFDTLRDALKTPFHRLIKKK